MEKAMEMDYLLTRGQKEYELTVEITMDHDDLDWTARLRSKDIEKHLTIWEVEEITDKAWDYWERNWEPEFDWGDRE